MNKEHKLAQKFNTIDLLKFIFPTIILMIFLSSYTSVDGAFVAQIINEDALAAINIVYPIINVVIAIGLMYATGSNAIISSALGAKKVAEARSFFSLIYLVGIISGIVLICIGFIFRNDILILSGANENLYSYAEEYLLYSLPFFPMCILQLYSQYFFVTEGKTKTSLIVSLLGGVANIVFDYVFMVTFEMGIKGAAIATGIGYCIPALYAIYYFANNKSGILYFVKPKFEGKKLIHTIFNGSSELINNLSLAITTLLFNLTMMKLIGNKGVSAITVILYIQFIQSAIYFGYVQGIAPIISYKYGANDHQQLKFIVNVSIKLTLIFSFIVIVLSVVSQNFLVGLFIKNNSDIFTLTKQGLLIVTSSFIFMGLNIFYSALFTAFGNGKISAILSFFRTFVFLVGALLIMPIYLKVNGVWIAIPLAESLSFIIGLYFFTKYKDIYHY